MASSNKRPVATYKVEKKIGTTLSDDVLTIITYIAYDEENKPIVEINEGSDITVHYNCNKAIKPKMVY